jgi:hypothetical protein
MRFELPTSRRFRTVAGITAALAVVVLLAGILLQNRPIVGPSETGRPSNAAPTASLTPEAWEKLQLPADATVAELKPADGAGPTISQAATFTFSSLIKVPAAQLALGLRVEPAIAFSIEPGPTAGTAVVRPDAPLAEGTLYRFELAAPDGSLAGTWAFRTTSPLHVVDRLPDDKTTEVPVDTGIEIGFDQDGTVDLPDHFSIEPTVTGRFEQHGRTWAFVPGQALKPATLYTITVRHGVGVAGSVETLETDVRWQFETAAKDGQVGDTGYLWFHRPIVEVRPGAPVDIAMELSLPEDATQPSTLPTELYRLPDLAAARAAAETLSIDTTWTSWTTTGLVDTTGLQRVGAFDARVVVQEAWQYDVLHLPSPLDAGWYLVVLPRQPRAAQVLVQVTDLAAYALTSETRTLAWINDARTLGPVEGAALRLRDGSLLGRSDANGLVEAPTPDALRIPYSYPDVVPSQVLTVTAADGRQLLVPLGITSQGAYRSEFNGTSTRNDPGSRWWLSLDTDRTLYRSTDTVHIWGLVRARSDRSVPADLELRFRPEAGNPDAPLIRVPAHASARGVFVADVHLVDIPHDSYVVDLYTGSERLLTVQFSVGEIRKPAFQINVTADRHVYVAGDAIKVSTSTVFYDGTAAPGLQLRVEGLEQQATGPTDASGNLASTFKATTDGSSYWFADSIAAAPVNPEEGEISGDTTVIVFPSRDWIAAEARLVSGSVVLDGSISLIDLAAVERQVAVGGWPGENPPGSALAGVTVQARVIHEVPVKTQVGTTYDFIAKKVVPVYDYSTRDELVAARSLTSSADGRFHLSVSAPAAGDSYRVELSAKDSAGRGVSATAYAYPPFEASFQTDRPYLEEPASCGAVQRDVALDQNINLTVREGNGAVAADGRYLFVVGRQGLDAAVLQPSPTFQRTFRDADLPDFVVQAVRFTAHGYDVTNGVYVRIDPRDKMLGVTLTPDRSAYAPGDRVTIAVKTVDAHGSPIAADVVASGVDEKLFDIGAASDSDPLGQLLASPGSGFLQSFTSHQLPGSRPNDGCGDAGGGRDDFADAVTFQRISTNASGNGTFSFVLPDDLTSWHISASAFSARFDAGNAQVLVPVGLPFFVDAIIAPDYLVGDEAVVRVRAFGGALKAGDPVHFSLEAPSLGLASVELDGRAFQATRFALPTLTLGDHRITIRARQSGGGSLQDALVRTVRVIPSRLSRLDSSQDALHAGMTFSGGDGLTTIVVTDAGRGSLLGLLQGIASGSSARFDQAIAADLARQLLIDEFDVPAGQLPAAGFESGRWQQQGIALLPYSSSDLFLTARAALIAPDRVDHDGLRAALQGWFAAPDATRERRIVALAGLAGMGDDVLVDLHAFDPSSLTLREQLWLGLGLLASGDEPAARAIERAVLASNGQRLGPWVRLDAGGSLETIYEGTTLLLQLAGGLGDPLAVDVSRYLSDQGSHERVSAMEQVGYARARLARLPRTAAAFAWTLDGQRHEVTLEPGGSFSLTLSPAQRQALSVEPTSGQLVVLSSWLAASATSDLPSDPSISIIRSVTPAANAPENGLVHVQIHVTFGATTPAGCYQVTDVLPSGLAPVVSAPAWAFEGEVQAIGPYEISGQRVSWCIDPAYKRDNVLSYVARVVSPGTYRWESAVVQSVTVPTLGNATAPLIYTIR